MIFVSSTGCRFFRVISNCDSSSCFLPTRSRIELHGSRHVFSNCWPSFDDSLFQEQRWGGVDKRKKHPRTSSREDASVDTMEQDSETPGETESKVTICARPG